MTVTQPDDVTNHAHDGSGAVVGLGVAPPRGGACRRAPKLPAVTTTPNSLNKFCENIFYSSELCLNQELSVFTCNEHAVLHANSMTAMYVMYYV